MTAPLVRVGDVLALERIPVELDPLATFTTIGIRSFGKGVFAYDPKLGAELGKLRFFEVRPNRLLVSNIKGWEGAVAVSPPTDLGWIASSRFLIYRPIDEKIDPSWARWFFLADAGLPLIQHASPGSADRNRTLAIERFENLEIPLPPIEEQRRMAQQLERLNAAQAALREKRRRCDHIAASLPLAVHHELVAGSSVAGSKLGDALEQVRQPIAVNPAAEYVTMGIRSFGKGIFHYPRRPGAEIGKLRFFKVLPNLLAVSNIKAWEGAIGTTSLGEEAVIASNRFLFFRPRAGEEAVDFFWSLLLSTEGLAALGRASPGSADRNRTLSIDRFLHISLPLPEPYRQIEIGRRVRMMRLTVGERAATASGADERVDALMPAALNRVFAGFS